MTIRVLLADDHALLREGLRALLSSVAELEVIGEAGNGRDALNAVRELAPDIILMDIAMPDLNGVEAARLIREKYPAVRIIMLSMHSNAEHVHRALAAGASGYLLKETAAKEVVTAVRAVMQGQRFLGAAIAELALSQPINGAGGPLESLSTRERQVLQLVVEGKSSAEIAGMVHLSPKTVETYRSRLMKKLGVADVTALVKFAVQHGLTTTG